MKRTTSVFVVVLFAMFFIASCGSSTVNETNNNEETSEVDDSDNIEEDVFVDENEGTIVGTISEKLIFIEASAFDGEANLVFETMEGEKINFYFNFFAENQAELDYSFIGEDGQSANTELVGKAFQIDYELVENGKTTVEGDDEDCYIISIAKLS